MDSEHGSESKRDSDAISDESAVGSSKSSEHTHSVSSSTSVSSSDDLFQFNPKIVSNSILSDVASSTSHSDATLLSKDEYSDSNVTYYQLESLNSSTATSSNSQVSIVTNESVSLPTTSPTQSPSKQVMERQESDPSRIPSSIFGGTSSPKEWSEVSNDSLFSIHIGNASPLRDHILTMGGDSNQSGELNKSEELYKSEDLDRSEEINKSEEVIRFRQTSPAVKGRKYMEKSFEKERVVDAGNNPIAPGSSHAPTKKGVRFQDEIEAGVFRNYSTAISLSEGNGELKDSSSDIRQSDGDNTISTIPIKKKSACPLCCSFCSMGSCCSRWPSCWVKCSCCSCKLSWLCCSCKWLSCQSFRCKWPNWHLCCCKWPSCRGCCCKFPSFHWKCPTWPKCHCKCSTSLSCCFKCPTWSNCCKCLTWPNSCKCLTWPSCCKCPTSKSYGCNCFACC